ncbi:MAG: hypothetical protein ABJL44_10705, partial [Algibacter sp.]
MKKVVLILTVAVVLPCVALAQGVNGTVYPGNQITYYGSNSNTTNSGATHFGAEVGVNSIGDANVYMGAFSAGNAIGSLNVAIGTFSGYNHVGDNNTFLGLNSGQSSDGNYNLYLGRESGYNVSGNNNVFLGNEAGSYSNGSNNVFLGNLAGWVANGDNRLYIDNSGTSTPLIYGKFDTDQVGINTNYIPSDYTFAVNGKMIAKEILVQVDPWPDFVFNKEYDLPSLKEVEHHIKEKGHLENIPSATEVEESGILLGNMNAKLLQKIEELTLYTIQQQKELE